MTIKGHVSIAGAYEHPRRVIPDRSVPQIHAEVALGALADAGLSLSDVDAYFCDSTAGFGPVSMVEYLGLHPRYIDSTETGGSSYLVHVRARGGRYRSWAVQHRTRHHGRSGASRVARLP